MTLHAYIDNEVPVIGEWTGQVFSGSAGSNMLQGAAYAWPERGAVGLRCSCLGEEAARTYCFKNGICPTAAAGETVALGFWYRLTTKPDGNSIIITMNGTVDFLTMLITSGGYVYPALAQDTGGGPSTTGFICTLGRWHYLQVFITRASGPGVADGSASFYADGLLLGSTGAYENFAKTAGDDYDMKMGVTYLPSGSEYVADYDEIKVGDALSDIEPYVPTPADENPSARRTVVIFRRYNTDSHAVVDAAITAGVPRGNCLGVACTTNENLADYATFQSEVENSLTTFLTNNPTIASNCTGFLLARNVPGSFTSGGVKHSATSRLMNFGTAFSSDTANPLYNPTTVARLTKTLLDGQYLAARCDGADGVALISRAATVSALSALAAADTLYSDESAYLSSLPCRRLRIVTAAMPGGDFVNDAFALGDGGSPTFGSAGSRVAFADDTASSASSLRTGSAACYAAINTGAYAAALGCAETAQSFDAEAFFEMLRIGGTFAEAAAVAVPYLDSVAVAAGWPLMTAAFQLGGYNLYRGKGGKDNIDYDNPVGYARAGQNSIDLVGLGHEPSTVYTYGIRTVSDSGVEEANRSVVCRVAFDGDGEMITPGPNPILWATAEPIAGGKVRLAFSYSAVNEPTGGGAAALQVAQVTAGAADWESPIETISFSGTVIRRQDLATEFDHGATVTLAVRAVTSGSVGGEPLTLSPVLIDAEGPAEVDYITAEQAGSEAD